jgi:hypothetical protein
MITRTIIDLHDRSPPAIRTDDLLNQIIGELLSFRKGIVNDRERDVAEWQDSETGCFR